MQPTWMRRCSLDLCSEWRRVGGGEVGRGGERGEGGGEKRRKEEEKELMLV